MSMNPHTFAFFGAVQTEQSEKWEQLYDEIINNKNIKVGLYNNGENEWYYITLNTLFFKINQENCELVTLPIANVTFSDVEPIVACLEHHGIEVKLDWHVAIRWG